MRTRLKQLLTLATVFSLVFAMACKDDKEDDGTIRSAEREIENELGKIVKGATFYFTKPFISQEGLVVPCQFPASQSWTPDGDPCDTDGKFPENDKYWDKNPTWNALTFRPYGKHYGQYKVESSGKVAQAKTTIFGRYKNCETGKWFTFSQTIKADPSTKKTSDFSFECSIEK